MTGAHRKPTVPLRYRMRRLVQRTGIGPHIITASLLIGALAVSPLLPPL
jgi:hypothetical protein